MIACAQLSAASAEVVAARGNGQIAAAPASVFPDATEGTSVIAFDEVQGVLTPAPIVVDVNHGALPIIVSGAAPMAPDIIPANTCVSSHYIHFDPTVVTREQAVFLFDFDIIGIIVKQLKLDLSALVLGDSATSYPNRNDCGTGPTCGLELGFAAGTPGSDSFFAVNLPIGGLLAVDVEAGSPADNIRVITEAGICQ